MKPEERSRVIVAIQTMLAGFGRVPDELTTAAYWLVLQDVSPERAVSAVTHCLMNLPSLPAPAQVRRAAGGRMAPAAPYHLPARVAPKELGPVSEPWPAYVAQLRPASASSQDAPQAALAHAGRTNPTEAVGEDVAAGKGARNGGSSEP